MNILLATIGFIFILQDTSSWNVNDQGVLINEYDVVSYFNGSPEKGVSGFTAEHDGFKLYFSSQENKELFLTNPEKYLPKYGGYCAYAMGVDGSKVKIDPRTYKIIDGQLYLFYNFWGNNTLKTWNKDEKKLKEAADSYWQQLMTSQ